jgi:hypothetical protein
MYYTICFACNSSVTLRIRVYIGFNLLLEFVTDVGEIQQKVFLIHFFNFLQIPLVRHAYPWGGERKQANHEHQS